MSIFAVVLEDQNAKITQRIAEKYPDHYVLNDTCFLVHDEGIANTVSESVGIKGDDRIQGGSGVVFKIDGSYSGRASRSLWDWIGKYEEEE